MSTFRKDFSIFEDNDLIYCDNAATTQKPNVVVERITRFYRQENAPVHRGIYSLAESATEEYEAVRDRLVKFLNAKNRSEIIFTSGATESINIVANSWARFSLLEGDEILISELEHHSNILPWQRIAKQTGAILKWIPVLQNGELNYKVVRALLNKKTKLVAVTAASNVIGASIDIGKILNEAKKVNARVLIDGAQLVPHAPCDVRALDCDFLVFSAHKMLGPTGVGVLYVKEEIHEEMRPYNLGGGMVSEVLENEFLCRECPYRFEAGTPNIAGVVGFGAALDYISEKVDFAELKRDESALSAHLVEGLLGTSRVQLLGSIEKLREGHLVSFTVEGAHPDDVATYLDMHEIAVRAGTHCTQPLHKRLGILSSIRVSFYLYNTEEDVERILTALREMLG